MTGTYMGPVVIIGGLGGVVLGGLAADALLARGMRDATLRVTIVAGVLSLPFAILFPLVSSPMLALVLFGLALVLGTVPFGAGVSTLPLITPNQLRGQVTALYLLVANLFGISIGALAVAKLTDSLFADPAAVGKSLAIAAPVMMAVGLILLGLALKPYDRMLDNQI